MNMQKKKQSPRKHVLKYAQNKVWPLLLLFDKKGIHVLMI